MWALILKNKREIFYLPVLLLLYVLVHIHPILIPERFFFITTCAWWQMALLDLHLLGIWSNASLALQFGVRWKDSIEEFQKCSGIFTQFLMTLKNVPQPDFHVLGSLRYDTLLWVARIMLLALYIIITSGFVTAESRNFLIFLHVFLVGIACSLVIMLRDVSIVLSIPLA